MNTSSKSQPLRLLPVESGDIATTAPLPERALIERAFERSTDLLIITDRNAVIEHVNPAFEQHTGYTAGEVLGRTPALLKSGVHSKAFYRKLWQTLNAGNSFRGDFVNRRKDGSLYHEDINIVPLCDSRRRPTHFFSIGRDITRHIDVQKEMLHLAYHDSLTGVANRLLLTDRLGQTLERARRQGSCTAVMFLDIDRFKAINDQQGHDAGDQLLKMLSARLCDCVRKSDTVARLSGDEFVVVLENIANLGEITKSAQKLLQRLHRHYYGNNLELKATVSVGIAVAPMDGYDTKTLLKHADQAMYRAKTAGGGCYRYFSNIR